MNLHRATSTETNITTIGRAVLVQVLARYICTLLMVWLILSYADAWIMAALNA